ncbi:hypothetical protein DICVIV_03670 [Dictyocaulus viviparus]|uniref:Uncharacterized protein n=1 Tax=Dictyocaulus viviparus TaxID=29172 RepID=A0A0D8Y1W6_DICVI|nr:hypothetical protein DICVIV_03670 [Dictyocaulus viviparus]
MQSVVPCFPGSSHENQMAIASGLFPGSQKAESCLRTAQSNTSSDCFEPIWSIYKRQAGGITALHSWPADSNIKAAYDQSDSYLGYRPDYFINGSLSLQSQLDMVLQWLGKSESLRPGLILVNYDGLRKIALKRYNQSEIRSELIEIDRSLDSFFLQLYRNDILGCVNIAIVSDQGE